MALKTLDVPKTSISDMKRSPMDVFHLAEQSESGVYVFNRDKVAGVILTQEQYEDLNKQVDTLYERIIDMTAANRLANNTVQTFSDREVRGMVAAQAPVIDEQDGWE